MSIQASTSNPRPNPLAGIKPPNPLPGDDAPLVPALEALQPDRLQLSPSTQLAAATKAATTPESTPETAEAKPLKPEGTGPDVSGTVVSPETTRNEASQPKTTPEAPVRKSLMNFPPYHASIIPLTEQRAAVERALGGSPAAFKGAGGATVDLSIAKRPNTLEGHEQFQLTVGSTSIEVTVAPDLDKNELLPRLVDAYAKVPEHLRVILKKVVLQSATNPLDEYWSKQFGANQFASGASAGDGLITFWKLQQHTHNLSQGTFNHELGHLIGEDYSTSHTQFATHVPPGWAEAAQADKDLVSDYAGHNPDEDFAETWSFYVYARTDPQAMAAMRERFPNRIKILDALYNNEFERKPKKEAARRSRVRNA